MTEWTPIIDPASELGGRARIVLEAITAQVPGTSDHLEASLFLSYRARADGDGRWAEAAIQQLNRAIRQAEAMWSTRRLGLCGGLAGLGFVVEQVARDAPDINEDTDAALLLELERGRWQGDPHCHGPHRNRRIFSGALTGSCSQTGFGVGCRAS